MAGINKVILVGNLGQDPEVKYMPSGDAVANITVATSDSWTDKSSGEKREKTEWHRVVFFGKLAEIVGQYLKKGSKVYVEGQLQTRKWQGQDGQDRYTTEIVVRGFNGTMQMLDNRSGGSSAYNNNPAPQQQAQQNQQGNPSNQAPPTQAPQQAAPSSPPQNFDNFDDDIPF